MILEQEYIISCKNCGFRRKGEDLDKLARERDKHKKRNPTHEIEWYSRQKTLTKIEGK